MNKSPLILLRSSWQSVNIGDIAHTPGMLRALQRFYPEARVVLWPCSLGHGARDMLLRHLPSLAIVEGNIDANGPVGPGPLADVWKEADFFLHGSGPGLMEHLAARVWHETTGKPYGFLGVTAESPTEEHLRSVRSAAFLLTRETKSIEHLKLAGLEGPTLGFCPDATFTCDLVNEDAAGTYLSQAGLVPGGFVCFIPRLRYTPYYKIHGHEPTERDHQRDAVNAEFAEADHAKMRAGMIRLARETDCQILVCPEMTYQVDIMDELLIDPLPEDVKSRVVARRDYWLPDEAASVYRQARAVVSFECHSPILALRQDTPVMYMRQPTDSIKGQMWRDVGLEEFILEIDEVTGEEAAATVVKLATDRERVGETMRRALAAADAKLRDGVGQLRAACEG